MKIQEFEGREERRLVAGLLTDGQLLGRCAAIWDPEQPLFESRYANLLAGWAVAHWEQHAEPPGTAIAVRFDRWAAQRQRDKETTAMVGELLQQLHDGHEGLSSEVLLEAAQQHFNLVRFRRLRDAIEEAAGRGDVAEAEALLQQHQPIQLRPQALASVLRDRGAWEEAFSLEEAEVIIKHPGALGEFYGSCWQRSGLVSFLAPEKRGKTFFLMDLAWRAAMQRRRVAFFGAGDMTRPQYLRRFAARIAARPLRPKTILWPTAIRKERDEDDGHVVKVDWEERQHEEGLDVRAVLRAARAVQQTKIRSSEDKLRIGCWPNSTLTVPMISSQLQAMARDSWAADVVVIDYADILEPHTRWQDYRQQTNEVWKALRRLSQEHNALVITATQANAASYTAKKLGRSNFSEDKRKLAHVTAMIALDSTAEERQERRGRLGFILGRDEDETVEARELHIAGCRDLCMPVVRGCF